MVQKVVFHWSGGKDSALALRQLLRHPSCEVVALFTTLNEETGTSSMHGIGLEILTRQAHEMKLPLHTMSFSKALRNYDVQIQKAVAHYRTLGVTHFAFGDIYMEGVKAYREQQLHPLGMEVLMPLWGMSPRQVLEAFFASGLRAKLTVVQQEKLPLEFLARELDRATIERLPPSVDPVGENGEYHTVVYAGDIFETPLALAYVGRVERRYHFRLQDGRETTSNFWEAQWVLQNACDVWPDNADNVPFGS